MKYLTVILLILPLFCFSQDEEAGQNKSVKSGFGVSVVQVQPEFPGGPDSLQSFLKQNLTYPDSAKFNRIQGRVYIGFLVDKKGKIGEAKVLSGVNELLDNEALRVVSQMPQWKPGTAGGNPTSVQYILPIDFIIPKDIQE
ncbi:MAG TPA: energy transducer TonB [Saprospiraceae bacterium]|nr:energy transducer TonB [Saprospiraceae bacterium]